MGRAIAFINAGQILLSSFLQFVGVYNNCYCGSNKISKGDDAYIVFLSAEEQADMAKVSWWVGFFMALIPCLGFILYFQVSKGDLADATSSEDSIIDYSLRL
jgi:hypothetical protein